jgi:cytochrome c oxidase subunit IV
LGSGIATVLVSLFIGATAGGLLLVHAHIYAPLLPLVITVLAVATASIVLREKITAREFDSESAWADRATLIIC